MLKYFSKIAKSVYGKIKSFFKSNKGNKEYGAYQGGYTNTPPRKTKRITENMLARQHGIPKCLRQYAKRYGGLDVDGILQIDRQQKRTT
jgi:hypothetical protein